MHIEAHLRIWYYVLAKQTHLRKGETMNYRGYYEQVLADGKDFIDENIEDMFDYTFDDMLDDMFVSDSVTGNASGSYTFNTNRAIQNVSEAISDPQIAYILDSIIDCDIRDYLDNPEALDVSIRCAMLYEVAGELEEYYDDKHEELEDLIEDEDED